MKRGESLKPSSRSSSFNAICEKPIFNYALIVLVIAALVLSILAFANVQQLKKSLAPKTININDFLAKLTGHPEMEIYIGVAPSSIVQINSNNLANLQMQIEGLDESYLGSFIVQYPDSIVIYDYGSDLIKGAFPLQPPQAQIPDDFFAKLNLHPEVQGLENEQPVGGQLDEASLNTLKQQFPDVYANAKVGDFLLRYSTKLVIYDYSKDLIVNAVSLE